MANPNSSAGPPQEPHQPQSSGPIVNGSGSQASIASTAAKPPGEMSNAEKKRLAKADKAAKRAKAKESQAAVSESHVSSATPPPLSSVRKQASEPKPVDPSNASHKRAGSVGSGSGISKPLQLRRRQSQSTGSEARQDNKQIDFIVHLYGQPRRRDLDGTAKEVHPAISTLALQQSNYVICGSHARCVAMLVALKSVISSYTTPHGTSLPRHLASHYLSPQLSHLKSARPFSTSQANSIRWLKNLIANVDPSTAEDDAKAHICSSIDTFIRDRFTVADQVIADAASQRIEEGDVVLTFGKSAVVQAALLRAAARGVKFRVIVVDGRPLMEGRHLAQSLASHVDVSYCLLPGLSHVIVDVTKCILGAHAVFVNGRLQSRVGSALVAMAAKLRHIPVMVCAESIKLTDRVALNSLMVNELAPEEELVDGGFGSQTLPRHEAQSNEIPKSGGTKQGGPKDLTKNKPEAHGGDLRDQGDDGSRGVSFTGLLGKDNLQLLNVLYDVTPSENLDIFITELGSFPPSAVPVVHRISSGS